MSLPITSTTGEQGLPFVSNYKHNKRTMNSIEFKLQVLHVNKDSYGLQFCEDETKVLDRKLFIFLEY
jgi:hypothetical protein